MALKILILGAGLQGRAAAFDLLRQNDVEKIILADVSSANLNLVREWLNDERLQFAEALFRIAEALFRMAEELSQNLL